MNCYKTATVSNRKIIPPLTYHKAIARSILKLSNS